MDFACPRGATHAAIVFGFFFFVYAVFGSEGFFAFSRLYFSLISSVFPFVVAVFPRLCLGCGLVWT